jgi:DNA-directed RNA polymerase specialized sigma24 family protein
MDEQYAIELCLKHKDPVGFEFLVQKYRREAFGHAYAFLGNQDDALDACQESFARAFAAIPGLPKLPQFYPWFYCILRNHYAVPAADFRPSPGGRTTGYSASY